MVDCGLSDFVDVAILSDQYTLGRLAADLRSEGQMLVCHGCDDVTEPIAGVVVLPDSEEAWVLCGLCMQRVRIEGQLAS